MCARAEATRARLPPTGLRPTTRQHPAARATRLPGTRISGRITRDSDIRPRLPRRRCKCGLKCPVNAPYQSPCVPGYFCPALSTNLTPCPPGHRCPDREMCEPSPCPAGTYQALGGQSACSACPPGTASPAAATSKDQCVAG